MILPDKYLKIFGEQMMFEEWILNQILPQGFYQMKQLITSETCSSSVDDPIATAFRKKQNVSY